MTPTKSHVVQSVRRVGLEPSTLNRTPYCSGRQQSKRMLSGLASHSRECVLRCPFVAIKSQLVARFQGEKRKGNSERHQVQGYCIAYLGQGNWNVTTHGSKEDGY